MVVEGALPNSPLLDELEKQKIVLSFGCRSGSCGVCRVSIHKGLELLGPVGVIEADTLSRCQDGPEVRLACQACFKPGAVGDMELERAPEIGSL